MGQLVQAEVVESGNGSMFVPAMSIGQAVSRYNAVLEFTKEIMKDGKDFGTVPGTDKPCLLKPGAEKLCSFFGLTTRFVIVEKDEDWTGVRHGGEQFFYYHYRAQLYRGDYLLGEAEGSCNSMESKYRFRWIQEDQVPPELNKATLKRRGGKISEPAFAVDKAETGGKYGKPASHWQAFKDAIANGTAVSVQKTTKAGKAMDAWEIDATLFRVPNPDIADQVNSIQKMGQKRALVAATLIVCNASEYYTQDIEDAAYIDDHVPAKPASSPQTTSVPRLHPDDAATFQRWIDHVKADLQRVLAFYKIQSLEELPKSSADECLQKIKDKSPDFMPIPKAPNGDKRTEQPPTSRVPAPAEPCTQEQRDNLEEFRRNLELNEQDIKTLLAECGAKAWKNLTTTQASVVLKSMAKMEVAQSKA